MLPYPSPAESVEDAYLGRNWPDNFSPYYIGISESARVGVKSRLSSHQRKRWQQKHPPADPEQ